MEKKENSIPIVQVGDKVLREKAKEVPLSEITSSSICDVIKKMEEALLNEKDGAALAAPQIGISLRIFILSPKVFLPKDTKNYIFINPVILNLSKKKSLLEEGCLSVRGKYGAIRRSEKATVRAFDEKGNLFTRGASGLMAQAFQHECDHLDGVLFIDSLKKVWSLPPSKEEGNIEENEEKNTLLT
jgi:peptide deformylase